MTVMETILDFLKNNRDCRECLQSKDIGELYNVLAECLGGTHQGSTITDILIRSGINPIKYVDGILPAGYRYYDKDNSTFDLDPKFGNYPNITGIGSYAYAYNEGIKTLYIPREIQILGVGCFEYCKGLEYVTFQPDSKLSSIGERCFEGCTNLKKITYLDSCARWDRIHKDNNWFPENNPDLTIECLDGVIWRKF